MFGISRLLTLTLATFAIDPPALVDRHSFEVKNGVNYTVFEHAATGAKLSFVTNSGICEITPGVNQFSGYVSVGENMNMWFWFFEARNSPSTAPLALWLNGGPGSSSMIGLFQENGPCTFNNVQGPTPVLNPNSWNNVANMLYVDQPIGTGFSFGAESATSTVTAAPFVWKLLQAFYAQFPTYKNRNFGLFTESYGGFYGPQFALYFESQNDAIDRGTLSGIKIPLVALGINNGWIDPKLQYKSLIDYSHENPYRSLIDSRIATRLTDLYNEFCVVALNKCASTGKDTDCVKADDICSNDIQDQITSTSPSFSVYDLRFPEENPFPPETYVSYLRDSSIHTRIGAQKVYEESSNSVWEKFRTTGDGMPRLPCSSPWCQLTKSPGARSFLSALSNVVQSGIQVLIWAGDADWICNTAGVQAVIAHIQFDQSAEFNLAPLVPYTVDGVEFGMFKTAGKLSFLNVFHAGHELPAYQPVAALQAFTQTLRQMPLSST
ncbi:putative carboxypeptidase S1 [Lactarius indigo]|nr:putative carboxypeptidase S1 [Lactarius indigo]